MVKVLLTWANGMLAHDFIKYCQNDFQIIAYNRRELDITSRNNIKKVLENINPDIILNCAAYTAVDEAEDIWKLQNFQINTLWVYNLAKISAEMNIEFITISTDYVFDGLKESWYDETDGCNPINEYGMGKHLGEKLALEENKNTIIIRTSWLYGWGYKFKNFVNTMLKLSETRNELKVVNDQHGIPTYTKDLSYAIWDVIKEIEKYQWEILHFSNSSESSITWFDFAKEIFTLTYKEFLVIPCSSEEFKTKAKRPRYSLIKNNSKIVLRDWKDWLKDYLSNI